MKCLIKQKVKLLVSIRDEVINNFAIKHEIAQTEAIRILFKIALLEEVSKQYDEQCKVKFAV